MRLRALRILPGLVVALRSRTPPAPAARPRPMADRPPPVGRLLLLGDRVDPERRDGRRDVVVAGIAGLLRGGHPALAVPEHQRELALVAGFDGPVAVGHAEIALAGQGA